MFCVSVKTWRHSDTPIWVAFCWTERMLEVQVWGQSGNLVKEQDPYDMGAVWKSSKGTGPLRHGGSLEI